MELIVLPTAWGLRNASPFNLKAQALLVLSGLDHSIRQGLPKDGPKGKLPAIKIGDRLIGDSSLIQTLLEGERGADFDGSLSSLERAEAEAYRKLAEEWLYFANLYVRWVVRPEITKEFFNDVPAVLRGIVFGLAVRSVRKTLYAQGIGRHTSDEVYAFGKRALDALAARIGNGPFFFGQRFTSVDAALWPQILNVAEAPHDSPLRDHARSLENLKPYCDRCDAYVFGNEPSQTPKEAEK